MSLGLFMYRTHNLVYSERQVAYWVFSIIAVLAAAKVLYGTSGYYFFSDDFLNFIIARDMGLSWRYLARSAQGEFIPLYRLADWAYFNLFGLTFWPYRIMLAIHQCAIIYVTATMFPGRAFRLEGLTPLLALIAFTPVFESSFQWWSAAINVLAEALASLIAMRLMADTAPLNRRRQCLSTAFYAAALCFFPKGLFVAAIVLSMRIYASLERGEKSLLRALYVAAYEVWPIFTTGLLYTAFVVAEHYSSDVQPPNLSLFLHYIWRGWNYGFLLGMLGLDLGFFGRVGLANILVFGLICLSILRNPKTLVLWTGFFIYFFVAVGTIAVNRAVPLGLISAELSRYHADITCIFLALLAMALSGPGELSAATLRVRWFAVSLSITLIGTVHLLLASARVPPVWYVSGRQVSDFVDNVADSLRNVPFNARIANGNVPEWVMPQWTFPLSKYNYFLLLFSMEERTVVSKNAIWFFTNTGQLHRISTVSQDRHLSPPTP